MPVAISSTRTAATTSRRPGKRRPPASVGDLLTAVLPEALEPVAGEAEYQQPRRPDDAGCGEHHAASRDAALDGDDGPPSVRHGEADVDRCDQDQSECEAGRRVQPPEAKRRRGLDTAKGGPPGACSTVGATAMAGRACRGGWRWRRRPGQADQRGTDQPECDPACLAAVRDADSRPTPSRLLAAGTVASVSVDGGEQGDRGAKPLEGDGPDGLKADRP